jgi:hypothetical protein
VATKKDSKAPTPEAQLRSYIDRFALKDQKLIRAVRTAVRKRLPTTQELAYDYTSHVVIAYSATDRAIDAIAAIDARADDVRLYLMQAPQLPDPKGLLKGSGKQARYVSLKSASDLRHPDIEALIAAAIKRAKVPLTSKAADKLVMRGRAAKRPPPRKPAK